MNNKNTLKDLPKQSMAVLSSGGAKGGGAKGAGAKSGGAKGGNSNELDEIKSIQSEQIVNIQDAIAASEAASNKTNPATDPVFKSEIANLSVQSKATPEEEALKDQFESVQKVKGEGGTTVTDPLTGGEIDTLTIKEIQQQAIADYIKQQSNAAAILNGGKTFQQFDMRTKNGDIIDATKEEVTAGLWSDNLTELQTYFTQSMSSGQSPYYVNVMQKEPAATGSAIQFALAYGHALGSGSSTNGSLDDSPTRAIYSQYRQLLLPKDVSRFSTPVNGATDSIYVLNFQRNRTKQKLDPGNFELPLAAIDSRPSDATGNITIDSAAGLISLIDDSSIVSASNEDAGNVYHVVSGSIANGVHNPEAPHYYGLVYCDHSTIILDGDKLDDILDFDTNTGSNSQGSNHYALFHSISGSYADPSAADKLGFKARNKEVISSTFYFVRVKNGDFNYSNNATYVVGDQGDIRQDEFIGDPKAYITTVGLYNASRELLAVAKLSKPLLKSKKRELNIRVKLEY